MKIDFCVELGTTNIEFHECFIMMAGVDMTFVNKKCHAELNFIIFFFKVELAYTKNKPKILG